MMGVVPAKPLHASTSEAVDDYLKAILELSGPAEERVTSNALAGHLGVRAASVTGMLQKLASRRTPNGCRKNEGTRGVATPSPARAISARVPRLHVGRGARGGRAAGALHL